MENEKRSFWHQNAVLIKAVLISILILLLLIPTAMIQDLIHEREKRQNEVIKEVSSKWGEQQTVCGPILSIPYIEYIKDENNRITSTKKYVHFLPEKLTINGELFPEKRNRSIYEVVVYNTKLSISGEFTNIDLTKLNIPTDNILWNNAYLSIGINDLRGIEDQIELNFNKAKISFNSGIASNDIVLSGINAPVTINQNDNSSTYTFSLNLSLKGSEKLYFVPIGKSTSVNLKSKWNNPSFNGAFLPDNRNITENGFTADWKIFHLNRNYPQSWIGNNYNVIESSFGIDLLVPVDSYQKSMRTVKYAILIIILSFTIFFFIEMLNKKAIHPLQYILVGFAICIFYILLISISEQSNFNLAYLISGLATISLISLYVKTIFKSIKETLFMSGSLLIMFGYVFTLIQLQDMALLIGSIGLFVVLAFVMYYSRNIDWYNSAKPINK